MFNDPFIVSLITGVPQFDVPLEGPYYTKEQKLQMEIPSHIVRAMQEGLIKLGYREVGFVDGLMGPRTFAALQHYQHDRDLEIHKLAKGDLSHD